MQLAAEPNFRLGSMEIRPATREALFEGGSDSLEPRVMQVLVVLARAQGAVVSRDALIEACWDGRAVSEDAVNRVISRLRRLSEVTSGRDFTLETITKVGYRLTVATAQANDPASPSPAPRSATPAAAPKRSFQFGALGAAIMAVLIGVAVLTTVFWKKPAASPLTLAVMPFDDLSEGGSMAYAGEGLAREIRNRVSRVRGLRVVADSSSFAVNAERLDARAAGARLGADLLLDGSVRIEGDQLRATMELVDTATGAQVWSQSYEGPSRELASAERNLSTGVLEHLVQRLGPDRIQLLAPQKPLDREAYLQVMEARRMLRLAGQAGRDRDGRTANEYGAKAEALVRAVLSRDPENADALELLAGMEERGVGEAAELSTFQRREHATARIRQALRADPDNPAALTALGATYRRFEWRWAEAEALLTRALAIDPNYADAHTWYAYYLSTVGRCREAVQHARTAKKLDPEFAWRRLAEPRTLKCVGDFALSDRLYREELTKDPGGVFLLREVELSLALRRDSPGLRALIGFVRNDLWKGAPPPHIERELARAESVVAGIEGAPAALISLLNADVADYDRYTQTEEVRSATTDVLFSLALEASAGGASDLAVDLLERAVQGGSLYIPDVLPYSVWEFTPEVRSNPRYRALWRSDPRLVDLLERRLTALRAKQMEGVLPNGVRVRAAPLR